MKVLVTGHSGYIGVHLVELLKQAGHTVTGVDLELFEGCEWATVPKPDTALRMDVRDLEPGHLEGHDCVMHLAALSNDPMGEIAPNITLEVNRDASVRLAQIAKQAGVGRYLFSGSCSVYGAGSADAVTEDAPLNPLTAYARSKVETEHLVAPLIDDGFAAAFLRNATAYGDSPMLRIDIVANNLLAAARAYGEVRIMSDGTPWRPLVHCRDIARAFTAFMDADAAVISGQSVNIGGDAENFQVRDVGEEILKVKSDAEVKYTGEVGHDPRSYRVDFARLSKLLPDFSLEYSLRTGVEELNKRMIDRGFGAAEFEGDQFVRLRTLGHRLERLGIKEAS